MFKYFFKKQLKRHDLANNMKLEALVRGQLLSHQALTDCDPGVGNDKKHNIVLSLTSFDKRIHDVYLCVESLFQQSLKADEVVLWLSAKNFPNKTLPETLRKQQRRGLQVFFVEEDLGPYKKYVYTFEKFPKSLIVTVDDDVLYPPDMLDMLYQAYLRDPSNIYCHRAHRIQIDNSGKVLPYKKWRTNRANWCGKSNIEPSHRVFPTGVGGVLYHPDALHEDAFDSHKFLQLCPNADDIWLKAMSIRQGTKAARVSDSRHWRDRFLTIQGAQVQPLKRENLRSKIGNDEKIRRVFSAYQIQEML
ncbi:glycosyltransferase [Microbulbifer epialgicus]|uniref:Glycosyltransferase n=1 Tax=Microbulbifer epialgicus TaxID=393907 RepID=A0ABV4P134_9GAMM